MAKVDRVYQESYLGETRLDSYSDRYQPLVYQDIYQGKLSFEDEIFFQNFFAPYLYSDRDMSVFLKSELSSAQLCSNELLSDHFDEIQYSYRLITLSYLLEGQWHLKLTSDHFRLKNGCDFDFKKWLGTCKPKSLEMKKFIDRLGKYAPKYAETIPSNYKKDDWYKEFRKDDFKWYSQYRLKVACNGKCSEEDLPRKFQDVCKKDEEVMTAICSEVDEVYGLSQNRDAYALLAQSNIINTYNKQGEAVGCLRRFSEVMAHREVRYEVLNQLFPALKSFLKDKYQERFLQGRVFFYGSSKEFEDKGLADFYVKEQPLKIEKLPEVTPTKEVVAVKPVSKVEAPVVTKAPVAEVSKKVEVKEIKKPVKSAFLQAAELRSSDNSDRVEVDMLKLKYDYVFSLNMINNLSDRLKNFMTREALMEMMNYDKLGTKEGPVPLLFIKFMIDMQEHQGLWNLVSVLGNRFYVSNEIDSDYPTKPEFIQIVNDDSTGRNWQLYILKP